MSAISYHMLSGPRGSCAKYSSKQERREIDQVGVEGNGKDKDVKGS